jgi:microcystin-dependent protein
MSKRFSLLAFTVALFPAFAFGAKPIATAPRVIATITSAEPFLLDGYIINTPGVTSYPLVVGDTVSTKSGAAVLVFREGSRLKLVVNSSVHITGADSKTKIILLGGALDYKLVAGSVLSVTNLDTEQKLAAKQAATPAHLNALLASNQQTPATPPTPDTSDDISKKKKAAAADADDSSTGTTTQTPSTTPDSTNPPASRDQGSASGAATPKSQGLFTNPKFLIPAAGIHAAGSAAGTLTLPPVSRHL